MHDYAQSVIVTRNGSMPHIVRAFFADPDLRYITA
jgi:hypothetical protein